jgi:glycosyltransferase involved in cell wall biosynthesis|tara:strand:+ start:486 stop:1628 length:1143 start_codon:yes stop_codon:yes gene_type:complete
MHQKHNKTKVLYIITKSNWGGAQRYVYDMAMGISKNGYEAVVALGGNGTLKEKLGGAGIRTITIPNLERNVNIFSEWKVFFDLLKIYRIERPNVIHLNSSKIGGLGALAGRFAKIKRIIFTVHGWAYKEDRNFISRKIIKFLSWLTIIFSHKTIAVSLDDYRTAPKLFVKKKTRMIHNGISEIKFKEKSAARNELKKYAGMSIPKGALIIGTISELHKNKGLPFMIRAVHSLIKKGYNITFFIISDGEEKIRLERFIERLGLQDRVFLTGHIDKASEFLQGFDIFTLTSVKEGLPYVLLEAGLAGLPIVATKIGGIPEIVENMKSGILVHPKNALEAERALSFLIDFKKKKEEFGNNLKEKVERDFTLEQMVADTVNLYS